MVWGLQPDGLGCGGVYFRSLTFHRITAPRRVPESAGALEPGDVPAEHFGLHPVRANEEAVPP